MARTDSTPSSEPVQPDETDVSQAPVLAGQPLGSPQPLPALPDELLEDDDDDFDDFEEVGAAAAPAGAPGLGARLGVEVLGTFALVLVVVGAALYNPLSSIGTLGVALAGGLVLAGATAALGRVSGGHFNPAVSLASAVAGRIAWLDLLLHWLAQVLGGVAAVSVLFVTVPTGLPAAVGATGLRTFMASAANGWGESSPLFALSQGQVTFDLKAAFVIELVTAAVLAAVFLGSGPRWSVRRGAPVAIGLTYAALLLVSSPITGGALNPARSTAAAIFAEGPALSQLWLFWVAPLLGGGLAGLVHRAFVRPDRPIDAEPPFGDLDEPGLLQAR